MVTRRRLAATILGVGLFCAAVLGAATAAMAQGNVVMGFDALMTINSSDAGGTVMGSNPDLSVSADFVRRHGDRARRPHSAATARSKSRKAGTAAPGMGFNFSLVGQADNPVDAGAVIPNVAANMFPLLGSRGMGRQFRSQPVCRGTGVQAAARTTTATSST